MTTTKEIYEQLSKLWNDFDTAHNGTKKKNAAEARKALGEMKKLITPYRQASTTENKKQ